MNSDGSALPPPPPYEDSQSTTASTDSTSSSLAEDVWLEQQRISRPLIALHILNDHYNTQPSVSIQNSQVPSSDKWLHSLVQAITRISANTPGRADGAAAAIEIHGANGASPQTHAVCKVRLAFSEGDSEQRLEFMNDLLDAVEHFVFQKFFGEQTLESEERFTAVSELMNNTLNGMIAQHNTMKLSKYLMNRFHKFSYVWEAIKQWIHKSSFSEGTDDAMTTVIGGLLDYASRLEEFIILFKKIVDPTTLQAQRVKCLALCIEKAWKLLHQTSASFYLEYAWEVLRLEGVMYDMDEDEVWDGCDEQVGSYLDQSFFTGLSELPRSLMLRVILTFARYAISCHIVVQSVYEIHVLRQEFNIQLELVPNYGHQIPISTQQLNLPETLQEVFDDLNIPVDIKSLPILQERWEDMLASTKLRVHPEIQLALFYAYNPEFWPESGIIATSKNPCTACQTFLGLMSRHHAEGRSLIFSYDVTQDRPDGTWMLPPVIDGETLPRDVQSLQRKMVIVAREMVPSLERELVKTIQELYYHDSRVQNVLGSVAEESNSI
ncbi:hypothetical protein BDQ17DRAFT_1325564 [Cyathus striatus]|nr:hypothetical protein BDQ17DRAFT_1325564 [Cyathus striatus]